MAWTTPRNWTPGERVTADMLNAHIRDNENYLYGVAATTMVTTTAIGTQVAFDPGIVGNTVILVNSAADLIIASMPIGTHGQRVFIKNIGQYNVWLKHEYTGDATVARRLSNWVSSGDTPFAGHGNGYNSGGHAEFMYDTAINRWRMVDHQQGGWIVWPFNAANFSAVTGTWTVTSGDTVITYKVDGTTLFFNIEVSTSELSATPSAQLAVSFPNGYIGQGFHVIPIRWGGAGTLSEIGFAFTNLAAGNVILQRENTGNFNAGAASDFYVQGQFVCQIR